jgi:hypothetical protein
LCGSAGSFIRLLAGGERQRAAGWQADASPPRRCPPLSQQNTRHALTAGGLRSTSMFATKARTALRRLVDYTWILYCNLGESQSTSAAEISLSLLHHAIIGPEGCTVTLVFCHSEKRSLPMSFGKGLGSYLTQLAAGGRYRGERRRTGLGLRGWSIVPARQGQAPREGTARPRSGQKPVLPLAPIADRG